ncbi:DUF1232 domain-containing protein [Desulfovibrio sp. OttesenSCG-928-G15]|nr:DUF1232 domain-containing protein [Desulfovibrio sp. OttesenSCG-928-G15]
MALELETTERERYAAEFSNERFNATVESRGRRLSRQGLLGLFKLYHVLLSPDTPWLVKAGIIVVLGYFICPIDVIPDFIPVVGYADDLALVAAEVAALHSHITPEIQQKAEESVARIIPE